MQKFVRIHAVAAPLALANVDTDMIIPAQHMKALTRSGLGKHLFEELRFNTDGSERDDFILNHSAFRKAQVLVAESNFGCGSSREHAVWALSDFGIRCVIAPSFGDIFSGNARKNGLLLIGLPGEQCRMLCEKLMQIDHAPIEVDLTTQQIVLAADEIIHFEIEPTDRHILLAGLDDVDRTLRHAEVIARFEAEAA